MDNSEKLVNFMQELVRLLMKYKFELWSCSCCGGINIYNINGVFLADEVDIGFKDEHTISYTYIENNNDIVRGEYYEANWLLQDW